MTDILNIAIPVAATDTSTETTAVSAQDAATFTDLMADLQQGHNPEQDQVAAETDEVMAATAATALDVPNIDAVVTTFRMSITTATAPTSDDTAPLTAVDAGQMDSEPVSTPATAPISTSEATQPQAADLPVNIEPAVSELATDMTLDAGEATQVAEIAAPAAGAQDLADAPTVRPAPVNDIAVDAIAATHNTQAAAVNASPTSQVTTPAVTLAELPAEIADAVTQAQQSATPTRLSLKLNPRNLGTVQVEVRLIDGAVDIAVAATSERGREAVEAVMADIRTMAASTGAKIGSMEVTSDSPGTTNHHSHNAPHKEHYQGNEATQARNISRTPTPVTSETTPTVSVRNHNSTIDITA